MMSREFYLLSTVLDRFEEARSSEKRVYVSDVARHFSKRHAGRSSSALGRRLHSRIWGEPWVVLDLDEVCVPFPLAWRFEFGWLLGVADQVCFRKARPYAIVEYKSYEGVSRADIVQVLLYGLLVKLNFFSKIELLLKTGMGLTRVEDSFLVFEGLRIARRLCRSI